MNPARSTARLALPVLAALALGACAAGGSGVSRADTTAGQMDHYGNRLEAVLESLGKAHGALSAMTSDTGGDVKRLFADFGRALDASRNDVRRLDAAAQSMRSSADRYFQNWEREIATISSAEMRQLSEGRRNEALEGFRSLTPLMESVDAALRPCLQEMEDVRKVLSNDLNPSGLSAVGPIVDRTGNRVVAVRERIAALASKVAEVRSSLSAPEPASRSDW